MLLGALVGCNRTTWHSPLERPIRLAASSGFTLHRTDIDGQVAGDACRVKTVAGHVQAVRGDTLLLASLRDIKLASSSPSCGDVSLAVVVLSSNPDIRAVRDETDTAYKSLLVILLVPAVIMITLSALTAISTH